MWVVGSDRTTGATIGKKFSLKSGEGNSPVARLLPGKQEQCDLFVMSDLLHAAFSDQTFMRFESGEWSRCDSLLDSDEFNYDEVKCEQNEAWIRFSYAGQEDRSRHVLYDVQSRKMTERDDDIDSPSLALSFFDADRNVVAVVTDEGILKAAGNFERDVGTGCNKIIALDKPVCNS
jgi:hypothetical protein